MNKGRWNGKQALNWIQKELQAKRPPGSRPLSPSALFYKKYDIFNAWSNLISLSSMKTPVNERLWN